jgi:hypothetical protein
MISDYDTLRYESEATKIVWVVTKGQIYEDTFIVIWPRPLKITRIWKSIRTY